MSSEKKKITLAELFCGTGGFSCAFSQVENTETIYANDVTEDSEKIFNLNHTVKLHKKNLMDIKDNEIPNAEILTAGFPCQPFSIAGMKKG